MCGERGGRSRAACARPEPCAVVDVEGDESAGGGARLGRPPHGRAGASDSAGVMPVRCSTGRRPPRRPQVVEAEGGTGRAGPAVLDPGEVRGAPLEEHQAGGPVRVADHVRRRRTPSARSCAQDQVAERVGADPADPGGACGRAGPARRPRWTRRRRGAWSAAATGGERAGERRDTMASPTVSTSRPRAHAGPTPARPRGRRAPASRSASRSRRTPHRRRAGRRPRRAMAPARR